MVCFFIIGLSRVIDILEFLEGFLIGRRVTVFDIWGFVL